MKLFDRRVLTFLAVGMINTCCSYAIYVICLRFFLYKMAYSLSFVFGVLISYILNSIVVFKKPMSFATLLKYPAVYAVQYGLGIVVLFVGVELLGFNALYVPLIAVCISVPVTYLMTKFVLS